MAWDHAGRDSKSLTFAGLSQRFRRGLAQSDVPRQPFLLELLHLPDAVLELGIRVHAVEIVQVGRGPEASDGLLDGGADVLGRVGNSITDALLYGQKSIFPFITLQHREMYIQPGREIMLHTWKPHLDAINTFSLDPGFCAKNSPIRVSL